MPDITIPDAAAEAAAHAMFEVTGEPDWTAMEIRQVVEAAAPYIAAQVRERIAGWLRSEADRLYPGKLAAAHVLRAAVNDLADRIEADHG